MTRLRYALEFAHVLADAAGDEENDVVGQVIPLGVGLLADDGALGFEIRGLDVGDEPPDEAGAKALLEALDARGRGVGGENDLVGGFVKGVEGVEKFLLSALLAGKDVDVVEEEHVDRSVGVAELGHPLEPNGVDEFVDKILGGDVANLSARITRQNLVPNRVQEVGLARPEPP